ncbi:TetR/AcrR family transcriptional regulator C-terminal domain-containing protein [Streptomyces sp. CA-181903]|uniref:TetR/AcrR family transcriptional regulator C-terminal domain-containing protein n=1 Tax=Streptomyces sp. CA-181903 TaxID=3240055 RepID=UPI003D8E3AD1
MLPRAHTDRSPAPTPVVSPRPSLGEAPQPYPARPSERPAGRGRPRSPEHAEARRPAERRATSTYTHVSTKDELIEPVVDEVYGGIGVAAADDPAGRREAAGHCAHDLRTTILRHPWPAPAPGGLGLTRLGPDAMRLSAGLLALFEAAGLPADEADLAVSTLRVCVIGISISISEAAWPTTVARSGRTGRG